MQADDEVAAQVILRRGQFVGRDRLGGHALHLGQQAADRVLHHFIAHLHGGREQRRVAMRFVVGVHRIGVALLLANMVEQARRGAAAQDGVAHQQGEELRVPPREAEPANVHVGLHGARPVHQRDAALGFGERRRGRRGHVPLRPIAKALRQRLHQDGLRRQLADQDQHRVVRRQQPVAKLSQRFRPQRVDRFRRRMLARVGMIAEDDLLGLLTGQVGRFGTLRQQCLLAILLVERHFVGGEAGMAGHVRQQIEQPGGVFAERRAGDHQRIGGRRAAQAAADVRGLLGDLPRLPALGAFRQQRRHCLGQPGLGLGVKTRTGAERDTGGHQREPLVAHGDHRQTVRQGGLRHRWQLERAERRSLGRFAPVHTLAESRHGGAEKERNGTSHGYWPSLAGALGAGVMVSTARLPAVRYFFTAA